MVKLQNGRVLILGGCTSDPCMAGTTNVEIFNPATNIFTPVASMNVHRVCFTATLLADGRVLVAGGYNPSGVLVDNETYDPAANTWTANAPMKNPHVSHAAVQLQDGRVLIVGGDCSPALPCAAADVFNPLTGKWKKVGPLSAPRSGLAAIGLQNGKILISGGLSYSGTLWQDLETCEAFDPATGKFVNEDSMASQRANFSMAMLPNGRVLAVGGDAWSEGDDKTPGDAELYTP
jgi:N-acetylneuraminic acid mutarotase